jgi:uncharacterized protein involved in type VI secretion and phage assembly
MKNAFEAMAHRSRSSGLSLVGSMLYEGIVTQNEDPEKKNRVVVKIASSFGNYESLWASVLSLYSGHEHGASFVPEIGDLVVVGFLSGDMSTPIVIGSVCGYDGNNASQTPPNSGKQSIKTIKTKSGHFITFDDTDGAESVTVQDSSGNKIVLDANEALIQGANGASVQIEQGGTINITTDSDCNVNAANVTIVGTGKLTVGSVPVPPKGFCALPACIFSGAVHTTNEHPTI